MLNMLESHDPQVKSETTELTVQQLHERLAELEAENAALRQLQETVRRNAKIFQAVLTKSHEGFLLVTPQLTFLRAIHSVLGNRNEDVVGRSLLAKIHPEDAAHVTECFVHLLAAPSQSVTVECRVSDSQGEWHWMEVEMTDMLDDPDIQAVVWNARAITERKKCCDGTCQTPTGRSAPV
jgi:PAS domain S-box-containing protein